MTISTATFAGGCFWCVEAAFNALDGVKCAVSGYTGGTTDTPTYQEVCTGTTDHAEAVQVKYDDSKISYHTLLMAFFSIHDATQLNRQGNDIGSQYRSAIFYHTDQQKAQAEDFINKLTEAQVHDDPIQTTVSKITTFFKAENYHQNYYLKNPKHSYCTMIITPKFTKFKKQYKEQLKI